MSKNQTIPAPLPADYEIDLERFYRFVSGKLDEYPVDEDLPSTRALIRRLVAAETALAEIAERDNVRDEYQRPPFVVAMERWNECVEIAKKHLRRRTDR